MKFKVEFRGMGYKIKDSVRLKVRINGILLATGSLEILKILQICAFLTV